MRVKTGIIRRKRHKRVLKAAKGFRGASGDAFKQAKQATRRAMAFATRDRKVNKRRMRQLWITRINSAARMNGVSYSVLMNGLKKAGILLDRKVLADIALNNAAEFTKLVEKGLAYEAEVPVNWCPALGTVLANEEVIDGKSERGGHPVYRKPMKQWMLKITAYADRLLEDLDDLDWPESIKDMQRNWIGRSKGAQVTFKVKDSDTVIAMAIEGDLISSEQLAEKIENYGINGKSSIVFIIGGSLGLSDTVKKRANAKISFGRITLPHQLMRLVLVEQIYRSFRITAGHAYHK